jgi:hypothetical protein
MAAGLALAIGATSFVTSADARHRWGHRHHGGEFAAGALGFTAGAFFGSALAPRYGYGSCYNGYSYYCDDYYPRAYYYDTPRAYYYDAPAYYAPEPRYAPAPRAYYRSAPRYYNDRSYGGPCDAPDGVSKPANAMC